MPLRNAVLLALLAAGPAAAQTAADSTAIRATALDYLQMAKVDGRWVIVNLLWERKPGPRS